MTASAKPLQAVFPPPPFPPPPVSPLSFRRPGAQNADPRKEGSTATHPPKSPAPCARDLGCVHTHPAGPLHSPPGPCPGLLPTLPWPEGAALSSSDSTTPALGFRRTGHWGWAAAGARSPPRAPRQPAGALPHSHPQTWPSISCSPDPPAHRPTPGSSHVCDSSSDQGLLLPRGWDQR